MRQGRSYSRRYFLGMLVLVTIAMLSFSSIPLVRAQDESVEEAVADGPVEAEDDAAPVSDEATEIEVEEEEDAALEGDAEDDSGAAEAEATEEGSSVNLLQSQQSKISEIIEKVKEISPQQKKKLAAGAIGIWGVAAGAGWVLNNLGGSDE
jgi:hypothetical protein